MPDKHVDIYTDGACSGNPGDGGWAAILFYKKFRREVSGGERDTTNNRMELKAIIEGLKLSTRHTAWKRFCRAGCGAGARTAGARRRRAR